VLRYSLCFRVLLDCSRSQRSADYAFRRPGTNLTAFFVEAKKPSIDIQNNADCHQAVLYGWNASIPLVVLTDFEQFLILDARSRPDIRNAAAHVLHENGSYTYRDYRDAEKFTEIWGLFSRQTVAEGSIDKAAAALPKLSGRVYRRELLPRGTRPVDEEFLSEMELWREKVAKSLKRTNHWLDGERLTSITQRILDRLIFLRFLEDRLIERDVTFDQISRSESAWRDFQKISKRLDDRYNGIIYKHDREGCDDPALIVDDPMFAGIVENLDPRNSDYLFGSIPVTILGSIYERFLGKVIVAKNKTAEVVWKPENLKQHGVYYTPDYIVRYIVEQTVGRCIAKKTAKRIAEMRFADIACGSGSFLVEVFSTLIRYHLRWYIDDGAVKWEKRGILRKREIDGDYVLTLAEKRRILLNNIYGIDIDPQAVEVTQLSLYLRLLEDESFPSTQLLFDTEHRALLPDLRDNIICGNSLIETDIGELFGLTQEEEAKIRPLDIRYAFENVRADKNGGMFDAVVGNPPYLYSAGQVFPEYFKNKYALSEYQTDFYVYFIERALGLLQSAGALGMIVSDSWLKGRYFAQLRSRLLKYEKLRAVVVFDYPPFANATIENSIIIAEHGAPSSEIEAFRFTEPAKLTMLAPLKREDCLERGIIDVNYSPVAAKVLGHLEKHTRPLAECCRLNRGIHAYRTDGYGRSKFKNGPQTKRDKEERVYHSKSKLNATYLPEIKGKDLERYRFNWTGTYLSYGDWLAEPRTLEFFEQPKLAIRKIVAAKLVCAFVEKPAALDQSIYIAIEKNGSRFSLFFLLGILSSAVGGWYLIRKHALYDTLYPWFTKDQLAHFPVPDLDLQSGTGKSRHDRLVNLVSKMLTAKEAEANLDGMRREHWTRQCEALDRQIDQLVYELYGLTEAELEIVEAAAK